VELVTVHGQLIITIKDGDGVLIHLGDESFTVLDKYVGVQWQVFHSVSGFENGCKNKETGIVKSRKVSHPS
jgi:hypothetical protein